MNKKEEFKWTPELIASLFKTKEMLNKPPNFRDCNGKHYHQIWINDQWYCPCGEKLGNPNED